MLLLLKHRIKLNKNSGMRLEESIEILKKLFEFEYDENHFFEYLNLLIKIFEISKFYQAEQNIDIIFLLNLIKSKKNQEQVFQICFPFLKKMSMNEIFLKKIFFFLSQNFAADQQWIFLQLSIAFRQKFENYNLIFENKISISNEIFKICDVSFCFEYLNENFIEVAFFLEKAFPLVDLSRIFSQMDSFFKNSLETIKNKKILTKNKQMMNFLNIFVIYFKYMVNKPSFSFFNYFIENPIFFNWKSAKRNRNLR